MNKDAVIVTKDGKRYPMSRYDANNYLINHNIQKFHTNIVKGIMYFYLEESYEQNHQIINCDYEELLHSDAIWEDDENALFEDFCLSWHDSKLNAMEALHEGLDFAQYDIVFINDLTDPSTLKEFDGHRIFVVEATQLVTKKDEKTGKFITDQIYKGHMMSTQIKQASINNLGDKSRSKNIYVGDYNSILEKGNYSGGASRPIYIDLSKRYITTGDHISETGAWKGHANRKFINFIEFLKQEMAANKDISRYYWENGPQYLKKEKR